MGKYPCKAYKHPDKAQLDAKDAAHTKFQEIAFAYAILSDERRRNRYDLTGNTSESLDIENDDFNWTDFFRAQWADTVTGQTLDNFKCKYQHSDEERRDVVAAYKSSKGRLDNVFDLIMMSNPLDDEERFREYINAAIESGEVDPYPDYTNEPENKKCGRHAHARREAAEAEKHAKKKGIYEKLWGNGSSKNNKNKSKDDEAGLAQLIQQRSKKRAATFLEDLEAKYVGENKEPKRPRNVKNGKKRKTEEPPEDAFQKAKEHARKRKAQMVEDDDERGENAQCESNKSDPKVGTKPVNRKKKKRVGAEERAATRKAQAASEEVKEEDGEGEDYEIEEVRERN